MKYSINYTVTRRVKYVRKKTGTYSMKYTLKIQWHIA